MIAKKILLYCSMGLKQIDHGSKEYLQMVELRNEIMRKPLGLTFSPEELAREKQDILIAAFDDDEMLGCCILTDMKNGCARLRQMAVQKNMQGKGIGESIMMFAENLARDKGFKTLTMHARDTAIGFYEKFGYKVKGEQFVEINIPHHIMEKRLV
jgi:N-acetylglutamate synthase-like GNAT family acetyltransferase